MDTLNTLHITRPAPGVAQVTMARAAVFNAFDEAMIDALGAAFTALGRADDVRVIVLAGDGKAFSAGADLQWMKRASRASFEQNLADGQHFAAMFQTIDTCPKPTIARVHGLALGGGVGLTCACDIAIASEDARFALSEARFGILPAAIGPYVINAIGKRQARRLALTAQRIDAQEALSLGLVHRVVPAAGLEAAVQEVVQDLLAGGPQAQAEVKALYAQLEVGPVTPAVHALTAQTISRVRGGDEAREGFDAFLSKRAAKWIP